MEDEIITYTIKDLCKILKFSRSKINMLLREQKIKYYRLNSSIRILHTDLKNYLKENQN